MDDTQCVYQYTLGFIFDGQWDRVLLVDKLRPEWQHGYLNGIGGKIEQSETIYEGIKRETKEESNLDIGIKSWTHYASLFGPLGNVAICVSRYLGELTNAVQMTDERIDWYPTGKLPVRCISNLNWLIPLAIDALNSSSRFKTTVRYAS